MQQPTADRATVEQPIADRWVLVEAIDVSGSQIQVGARWADQTAEVTLSSGGAIEKRHWTFLGLSPQAYRRNG